ncbi:DUF3352 domain-containing protein [Patulibacter americanus]|uniref:DUF3352 domain-containing protein n=1 Tax=Patulibacter americanus TaxID=588672 RepID=UPI0003B55BC6|nr:DUF3352 domain-containing protein [Patulibacter americanus]
MTSTSLPRTVARRAVPLTAIAVGALAFAGCGGGDDESGKPATPAAAAATTTGAAPKAFLADDVPAKVAAYAEATFRPGQEPKAAIEELSRLFGVADPGGELMKSLDLDDELESGKTFEKDVLPHLGDHVGAFLLQAASASAAKKPQGAIVAEVKDADALRATLEPALKDESRVVTVAGQQVYRDKNSQAAAWIGDDLFAMGTEDAVRATIEATEGETLDGNARYKAAIAQVRASDPLGLTWVDLQQAPTLNGAIAKAADEGGSRAKKPASGLTESQLKQLPPSVRKRLESSGGGGGFGTSGGMGALDASTTVPTTDATIAMALSLRPGRATVSTGGTAPEGLGGEAKAGADAVAALPGGSWLAFGAPISGMNGLGATGPEVWEQLEAVTGELPADFKAALGKVKSVSGAARGDSLLGAAGGVVLQTEDDASAKALLDGMGGLVKRQTGFPVRSQDIEGADAGLVAAPQGLPLQIAAGQKGDRVAIGLGVDSVTSILKPSSKFGDDPTYDRAKQALGGATPSVVINPKPLTNLIGSLGVGEARQAVEALQRLKLIAGSQESTGATTWRGTFVVDYDASQQAGGTTTTP